MKSVKEIMDGMLVKHDAETAAAEVRLRRAGWVQKDEITWRHPTTGQLFGTFAADDARREEAQRGSER